MRIRAAVCREFRAPLTVEEVELATAGPGEVTVKIAARHQPIPPEAAAGVPFRPVEFDGLTVTPYVNESGGRPRVAYSLRATGMRAPHTGARPTPRAGGSDAAA